MVVAALAVARERHRRAGVELVLTAGEETGCAGAERIVATPHALGRVGALVVGEPTGLLPKLGHRGVIWLRLRFRGRTALAGWSPEDLYALIGSSLAQAVAASERLAGARRSG